MVDYFIIYTTSESFRSYQVLIISTNVFTTQFFSWKAMGTSGGNSINNVLSLLHYVTEKNK
jgi:hypothetical protein